MQSKIVERKCLFPKGGVGAGYPWQKRSTERVEADLCIIIISLAPAHVVGSLIFAYWMWVLNIFFKCFDSLVRLGSPEWSGKIKWLFSRESSSRYPFLLTIWNDGSCYPRTRSQYFDISTLDTIVEAIFSAFYSVRVFIFCLSYKNRDYIFQSSWKLDVTIEILVSGYLLGHARRDKVCSPIPFSLFQRLNSRPRNTAPWVM